MSDRKFTILELHIDGETQLGPKTLGERLPIGEPTENADADEDEITATPEDEDTGGNKAIGVLIGLVVLAAIAVAAKKFRGGDDEELEEFDEPDVVVD